MATVITCPTALPTCVGAAPIGGALDRTVSFFFLNLRKIDKQLFYILFKTVSHAKNL